jgi:hypothetical protein
MGTGELWLLKLLPAHAQMHARTLWRLTTQHVV